MCAELWMMKNHWMNFGGVRGGKGGLAVVKRVGSICNRVMEVGECIVYLFGKWWQIRKQFL